MRSYGTNQLTKLLGEFGSVQIIKDGSSVAIELTEAKEASKPAEKEGTSEPARKPSRSAGKPAHKPAPADREKGIETAFGTPKPRASRKPKPRARLPPSPLDAPCAVAGVPKAPSSRRRRASLPRRRGPLFPRMRRCLLRRALPQPRARLKRPLRLTPKPRMLLRTGPSRACASPCVAEGAGAPSARDRPATTRLEKRPSQQVANEDAASQQPAATADADRVASSASASRAASNPDRFVRQLVRDAGVEGVAVSELSKRVRAKYRDFKVRDLGYSQFRSYVADLDDIEIEKNGKDFARLAE